MQNSQLTSLASALPASAVQSLASHLGTSESSVLDGVRSSMAAVIDGLSQKATDKDFLGQLLQTAKGTSATSVATALSNGTLTNPTSSFASGSSQFLSSVFGGKLISVTEALSRQTGLRSAAASTLLALGAQTVLGFLGEKVKDGSITVGSLPGFLQRESEALKSLLPSGLQNDATVGKTHKVDVNPVIAQTVQREGGRSILPWLLGLLVAAALLGFWWFHTHQQPEPVTRPSASAPVANTVTSTAGADLGMLVATTLPDGTTLRMPEHGVEGKLLAFIKDSARTPDKTSWFDFDRLLFNTGSATLQPQSAEQLNNIASILKAYPAVHLMIGGYTDNTGDAAQNLKLSQDRADNVVSRLTTMGVASNRLEGKGYGDQHPVADNSSEEGRALNRRISMLVTAK